MNCRWLCILVAGLVVSMGYAGEPAGLPAGRKLELFLLIGQSNMAGRGKVEEEDRTAHGRVWMLDKEEQWRPAVDPLHFDKPKIAGVCLGTTFGKVLAERDAGAWIGLIPAAVGGTSIDQWKKGGELYENAVKRAKVAMRHGTIKGILWHQGEGDSSPEKTAVYGEKLAKLIVDLRSDLESPDVPFVVGQLGEFRYGKAPSSRRFNEMLLEFPGKVKNVGCAKSEGLKSIGDDTHFDAAGLRELGRRYAGEYWKIGEGNSK